MIFLSVDWGLRTNGKKSICLHSTVPAAQRSVQFTNVHTAYLSRLRFKLRPQWDKPSSKSFLLENYLKHILKLQIPGRNSESGRWRPKVQVRHKVYLSACRPAGSSSGSSTQTFLCNWSSINAALGILPSYLSEWTDCLQVHCLARRPIQQCFLSFSGFQRWGILVTQT